MVYHLHRAGKTEGIFELAQLHERRQRGELTGAELVWREGMSSWQPLDAILTAEGLLPPVAPLPRSDAPAARAKHWIVGLVIAALVCGLLIVGGIGFLAVRTFHVVAPGRPPLPVNAPPTSDVTAKPLSWSTNTLTEKDVRKRGLAFRTRQYLQAYQQNGRHDQPCDADARRFLNQWLEYNFTDLDPTNLPAMRALGDKIAATPGCDDPLVLMVAAAESTEMHEKISRLERAIAGYEHSNYKAYPRLYATSS